MINLLEKIFGKKDKTEVRTSLTADEIKPFFKAIGIDIEHIGFPDIESRHRIPTERYNADFDKIKITPVYVNDTLKAIITGKYETWAMASSQDSAGDWHPGTTAKYSFRIKNDKLDIWRTN